MARLISREFNPAVPVVVRRFFVAAGRHWNPGDQFDWPRLAIAQRRVKQLFENGKLMHVEPARKSDWAGLQAREMVGRSTPAPTVQTEFEDDAILAAAVAEPDAPVDELDDLDMKALREIAAAEGAPTRVSREAQRAAIRENRRLKAHADAG